MLTRPCPLCGSSARDTILELEADAFCRTNWTYSREYRSLLGLPDRAVFPIVRCRSCGMQYAELLPSDEFLTTLYERVILSPECVRGSENRASYASRLRYVADLLELAPTGAPLRALDFGSGLGVTLRILSSCGAEATGFDPSVMRSNYTLAQGLTLESDLAALHGPFDVVVLDNVLEHLPEPRATMELLRRITVEGAVAYVSVPSSEAPFMREQVARHRRNEPIDMTLNPWEHLNYFTVAHLNELLSGGGFRRLAARERVAPPSIGLRAEPNGIRRWKNAIASMRRLGGYAMRGEVTESAERGFYRRDMK